MKMLSALACAALLSGCATVNPAYKAKTDELISKPGQHREPNNASTEYKDWKPGSWVALKLTSDGKPQYMKMSILSQGPEGVWTETETWSYDQHTINKNLYSRMPTSKDESVDLLVRVISKRGEEPVETLEMDPVKNPAAGMFRAIYKGLVMAVPGDIATMPQETVSVAAGTFEGARKYQGAFAFGPIAKTMDAWWHPNVPVNGGVKGVTTDGSITYELLDYGWTGATSALP